MRKVRDHQKTNCRIVGGAIHIFHFVVTQCGGFFESSQWSFFEKRRERGYLHLSPRSSLRLREVVCLCHTRVFLWWTRILFAPPISPLISPAENVLGKQSVDNGFFPSEQVGVMARSLDTWTPLARWTFGIRNLVLTLGVWESTRFCSR